MDHHAHGHAHGPARGPGRRRRTDEPRALRRLAWLVLVPVAVATLVATALLWPTGGLPEGQSSSAEEVEGQIVSVERSACTEDLADLADTVNGCGTASVRLGTGGDSVEVPLPNGVGAPEVEAGDDVVLTRGENADGVVLTIVDHQRGTALWILVAAFALALVAFGRWRGLSSLAGLVVTFAVLGTFVVPAVLAGESPLLVAVVGSTLVILVVLHLTHGFSPTTTVAVLGTLGSFAVTALLGWLSVTALHLSGVTDDIALSVGTTYGVQMQGLLLAGIVIGSVGVLDDVTVTQASTVDELARANPGYGARQLFRAGQRVGRAHVASVVNTIVLAYAGSSLPVLVLVLAGSDSLGGVVTDQFIAQEIVRSIVATLGLVAAVPLTTALAALSLRRGGAA